jgi:hypothetical protein
VAEAKARSFQAQDPVFEKIEPAGKLSRLRDYWQGLVPSGLPGRQHIDPLAIGSSLLAHVFLADVIEGGMRFRWRLIGTHIVTHAGTDDTGQELDATVAPRLRDTIIGHYRLVTLERRPLCHRSEFIGRDKRVYRYERLLLPMAADGATVDMIFGGAVFGHLRTI